MYVCMCMWLDVGMCLSELVYSGLSVYVCGVLRTPSLYSHTHTHWYIHSFTPALSACLTARSRPRRPPAAAAARVVDHERWRPFPSHPPPTTLGKPARLTAQPLAGCCRSAAPASTAAVNTCVKRCPGTACPCWCRSRPPTPDRRAGPRPRPPSQKAQAPPDAPPKIQLQ